MDERAGLDPVSDEAPENDWCVEIDGERFAGRHLLLEFHGAHHLDDPAFIARALNEAATAAKATVLETKFHKFSQNGGVTGVVLLAESHISIHTWPEHDYAAIDIFMCGNCDPHEAVPALRRAFDPARAEVNEQRRGKITS